MQRGYTGVTCAHSCEGGRGYKVRDKGQGTLSGRWSTVGRTSRTRAVLVEDGRKIHRGYETMTGDDRAMTV